MPNQLRILNNLSECTVVINEYGKIEFANPAIETTLGYRPVELVGKSINVLVPRGKSDVHQKHLTHYFKNPTERKMGAGKELFGVHKNGTTIPIEVSLSHFSIEGKNMSMAIVVDISERKRILDELSYSQSLYLSLVENTTDHIFQIDRQLNVLYVNHVSPGLSKEQVIGSNLIDLIPGEEMKKKVSDTIKKVFETGKPNSYEIDFPSPVGELHYATTASPVIKGGQVKGVNLVTRDVTKDINLKNELVKQKNFIEKIDQYSLNGIFIYDIKERRNTYVNKRFEEILGYNLEDINQMTSGIFHSHFHPDDREKMKQYMDDVAGLAPGKTAKVEYRFRHKNGNWIWCLSNISGFEYDDDGTLISVIGALIDITHQKLTERSLLLKNKEIEKFAYIASHDLKSPLSSIISGLKFINNGHDISDDEKKMLQEEIMNSAYRMNDMINSLLAQAKIEKEQEKEIINCNEIMKEVEVDLKSLINDNNATIEYNKLPDITGVKSLFRLLMQNLVSNAIKYKYPSRDPEIQIQASEHVDYWLFTCTDNGIGIDQENQHKIFEIFERAPSVQHVNGTGIGLANCKKIVQAHGGEIWVESEPEKGSSFFFTINKQHNSLKKYSKRKKAINS